LHPLAEAVRLANEFQGVGVMSEPVEQSSRQRLIPKDLNPVGKA